MKPRSNHVCSLTIPHQFISTSHKTQPSTIILTCKRGTQTRAPSQNEFQDIQSGNNSCCPYTVTIPFLLPMSPSRLRMPTTPQYCCVPRLHEVPVTPFEPAIPGRKRTSTPLSRVLRKTSRQAPQTVTGKAVTAQTIHTAHPARYPSPDHSRNPANPVSDQTPDQSDPYAGYNPMQ